MVEFWGTHDDLLPVNIVFTVEVVELGRWASWSREQSRIRREKNTVLKGKLQAVS
jgi:hypothetical protein